MSSNKSDKFHRVVLIAGGVLMAILLLMSAVFFSVSYYKNKTFGDAKIDEIIFYFNNGLEGAQTGSLQEAFVGNIHVILLWFAALLVPLFLP